MNKVKESALKNLERFDSPRSDKRKRQYDVQNFHVSLKQWRMLHAVIDCGGFSDAAEFLHLSQSAISYTIGKLQEQLGIPLLKVEGRKAHITEEGKALLQRSRGLLKAAIELEMYAESLRKGSRPDMRLVVEHAFPPDLLMLALHRFAIDTPNVRVQLDEVTRHQAEEALAHHAADLTICSEVPHGFLGELLVEIEYVAVAHPDHPLFALGREIEAADLVRHVQIVVSHPKEPAWQDRKPPAPEYIHRWRVSSFDSALEALHKRLGYAWLPYYHVRKYLDGRLAVLPMQERSTRKTNFFLVHGRPWVMDAGVSRLVEILHSLAPLTAKDASIAAPGPAYGNSG